MPAVTVAELRRWRLRTGRPGEDEPIGPMSKSGLTNWAWRTLKPMGKRVTGRDDATLPAAARRLGHSGQVHLGFYGHVIDALEGQPKFADLDALIEDARAPHARERAGLAFP